MQQNFTCCFTTAYQQHSGALLLQTKMKPQMKSAIVGCQNQTKCAHNGSKNRKQMRVEKRHWHSSNAKNYIYIFNRNQKQVNCWHDKTCILFVFCSPRIVYQVCVCATVFIHYFYYIFFSGAMNLFSSTTPSVLELWIVWVFAST